MKPYVPAVWWKGGEIRAVEQLTMVDKLRMTPLFALPPARSAGDPGGRRKSIGSVVREVARSWGGTPALFDLREADTALATATPPHPVEEFFSIAVSYNLQLIPVTGLHRSLPYQTAVKRVAISNGRGAALRLSLSDLGRAQVSAELTHLLSQLQLDPASVDLLVDLQFVGAHEIDLAGICAIVPGLPEWRSFAVIAGAFPKDLGDFDVGSHLLARTAWRSWRDGRLRVACLVSPPLATTGRCTPSWRRLFQG